MFVEGFCEYRGTNEKGGAGGALYTGAAAGRFYFDGLIRERIGGKEKQRRRVPARSPF